MPQDKVNVAEQDAKASKLYARLQTVAAEVFVEKGAKRSAAVRVAADLVTLGYSLRKAAKAAGQKPDNKLQRYFEVARAMVTREETPESPESIAPPEGFGTWSDAVAAMPLEAMAAHIRDTKAGRKPTTAPTPDEAVRSYLYSALGQIERLVAGEAGSVKVAGLSVDAVQVGRVLKAFVADGFKVTENLDKCALTARKVDAVQTVADKLAAMLQAPANLLPAVVNG